MNESAPIYLLVGYHFLTAFVCNEREYANLSIGIIPMFGIGPHSFIDGIIYSVTFNVSIFTGALSATEMAPLELPERIVTFLLLERAGLSKKKSAVT